jgi:hypothetical protein
MQMGLDCHHPSTAEFPDPSQRNCLWTREQQVIKEEVTRQNKG